MNRQRTTNSLNLEDNNRAKIEVLDDTGFSFANAAGDNDSAFSISAWIYMNNATYFPIANKMASSNREWQFGCESSDKLYLILWDESTGKYRGRYDNTALTSRENEWIHVACTYSGDESDPMAGINIYIDGEVVDDQDYQHGTPGTYDGMEQKSSNLIIGNEQVTQVWADGKIDDLCIYNDVLTATEVKRNYNAGKRSHR